ncbi:MAG: hypothetical protein P4L90_17690 [Rhodopila sp.]|nr:hypothetical protein [Rhodopila sp.]
MDDLDATASGENGTTVVASDENPSADARRAALTVGLLPALNLALWSNHVAPLTELSLFNPGPDPWDDITIDLESDVPATRSKTWRLSRLAPGQVQPLGDL